MKTIVIYDQLDAHLNFFVVEGDYSRLDGVYINHVVEGTKKAQKANEKLQDELEKLVYGDSGEIILPHTSSFPVDVLKREDSIVIITGFLP
jgi:hypothetical protein